MINTIHTAEGTIEFADVGSGPPVLYFHGILSGSDVALLCEKSLLEDGFRLIIPHRPGYLGTRLKGYHHSYAAACADVAAQVLDHLGIERANVIGTSAGGPPAMDFAIRHPERTSGLVLQCAQIHRWDSVDWLPVAHQWTLPLLKVSWTRWLACFGYFWMSRIASRQPKNCLKGWASRRFSEIQDDENAIRVADIFTKKRTGLRGFCNDMTVFACDDVLSKGNVDCPTLILHDPLDDTVPIRHAEYAASHIPNAQLVKLNLGGHYLWAGREITTMQSTRSQFLRQHS